MLSALLLSVTYLSGREDFFQLSFGLTFIYLGFGLLLMLCLEVRGLFAGRFASLLEGLGTAFAYLGKHSYSIYLWHAALLQLVAVIIRKRIHVPVPQLAVAVIDIVGSCGLGILLAHIIEFPVLTFRDRIFPALQEVGRLPLSSTTAKGKPDTLGSVTQVEISS
jgi:peptidoglycan/LPS O-acetylase OafA/YrhL